MFIKFETNSNMLNLIQLLECPKNKECDYYLQITKREIIPLLHKLFVSTAAYLICETNILHY